MGNEASQQIQQKYGDKLDNDITISWSKSNFEDPFQPREGHSSCSHGNRLFVFGGLVKTGELDTEESNDLILFDLDTSTWTKIEAKGQIPAPRVGATIQQIGGKLYLFGGLSRDLGWFQDLYIFDIASSTWSKPNTTGQPPSMRDKLSSAVIGTNMYIFGGFGPQAGMEEEGDEEDEEYEDEDEVPEDQEGASFGWFNDIHVLDTDTNTWSSPMYMNLALPTQRAAADMCAIDKYLVIFGGRDAEGRKNDLHIYNTETRKWETELNITGQQPAPRSFHTVTAVGPRVVVLGGRGVSDNHFGDVHIFDTISRQWLQPKVEGESYTARGTHSATVVGERLIIYGGTSNYSQETMQCQVFHKDMFMLNTAEVLAGGAMDQPVSENKENCRAGTRNNLEMEPEAKTQEHTKKTTPNILEPRN